MLNVGNMSNRMGDIYVTQQLCLPTSGCILKVGGGNFMRPLANEPRLAGLKYHYNKTLKHLQVIHACWPPSIP